VKKAAITFTATLLGLGLATGAWGQARPSGPAAPKSDTSTKSDTGAKAATDDAQRQVWSPDAGAVETGKLVGTKVKTIDGESVGSIDQLIVNEKDGKITHAIITKGGLLGVGGTKLVFRWSDVKLQRDPDSPDHWLGVVDQAKLDAAPKYEARKDHETTPAASPGSTPPLGRPSTPAKKY
jgi:sporulation protein YlmC with PRC-barrel domain